MDSLLEQRIQYFERLLSTKTRSPIVVQLASLYLEAGRPHDALHYCDSAIAHFPYYTTAHLIRAKVLQALEMNAEARREFEFVHSILPDVEGVRTMLEQIPASDTQAFREAAPTVSESVAELESEATTLDEEVSPAVSESVAELESETASLPAVGESVDNLPPEASPEGVETGGARLSQENPVIEEPAAPADARDEAPDTGPFGLGPVDASTPLAEAMLGVTVPEEPALPKTETTEDVDVPQVAGPAAVTSPAPEEYEQFAARMSEELAADGDALTLEEFFTPTPTRPEEHTAPDHIEELAEKLKSAPRITPIIDITDKKTIPPSEEDTPASMEFVTPTLAEIYAKQGWYDDAITAYKTLARIKPAERERFERRVQELEQLKKSGKGGSA